MIVNYSLATATAVYQFEVNKACDKARVTRWILKGQKGVHASTSMSIEQARKLAVQLKAK